MQWVGLDVCCIHFYRDIRSLPSWNLAPLIFLSRWSDGFPEFVRFQLGNHDYINGCMNDADRRML